MSEYESVCVCHCLESIVKIMTLCLTAPQTNTCTDIASGHQTGLILGDGGREGSEKPPVGQFAH